MPSIEGGGAFSGGVTTAGGAAFIGLTWALLSLGGAPREGGVGFAGGGPGAAFMGVLGFEATDGATGLKDVIVHSVDGDKYCKA